MAGNSNQNPDTSSLVWIRDDPLLGIIIAIVFIGLYVLPVYLTAFVAWTTQGFQNDHLLLDWVTAFIKSPESTLNQFHKVLMPFLTGLSVVVLSGKLTRSLIVLIGFLILSYVFTIGVSVFFDMKDTVTSLRGLSVSLEDIALAKAFFTRVQETLFSYVALICGLGIVGRTKRGNE